MLCGFDPAAGAGSQIRESGVPTVSFACRFGAAPWTRPVSSMRNAASGITPPQRPEARVRNGLRSETGNTDDSLRLLPGTCCRAGKVPELVEGTLWTPSLGVLSSNASSCRRSAHPRPQLLGVTAFAAFRHEPLWTPPLGVRLSFVFFLAKCP